MNNDLISREALKKKIQARHDNGNEDFDKGYNIGLGTAIDLIDNAPTVEYTFEEAFKKTVCENGLYCPARPKGKWYDCIEKTALKARHGDYVLYKIDYLLDHLAREIYLLESVRRTKENEK